MTAQSPPLEYLYANRWKIWGVVMIGLFMALIDVTIVMSLSPASPSKVDQSPELPPLGPSRPGSRSTGRPPHRPVLPAPQQHAD